LKEVGYVSFLFWQRAVAGRVGGVGGFWRRFRCGGCKEICDGIGKDEVGYIPWRRRRKPDNSKAKHLIEQQCF
jgi:hypothetical protein